VPELYDRARPGYPAELFDELVALAGLAPGDRVLEVGCGSGKATSELAERGLDVVCVELGSGLAAVARRNLTRYPRVRIVEAAFESWENDGPPFAAVVAFSSFHWIDPAVRYAKAASVLRRDGALAVAGSLHVLPADGDPFFNEVQADYEAVSPGEDNRPPPDPSEVQDLRGEIEASGLFAVVAHRRRVVEIVYGADEYLDVLRTFSGHRALDPERRRELLARIRRRIEARPGGRVRKSLLVLLTVARRV
jgi:SAM-dependent methyltransferase